jgi:hypothetical protein
VCVLEIHIKSCGRKEFHFLLGMTRLGGVV